MESESKIEAAAGLKDPEVGQDSEAGKSNHQSTNSIPWELSHDTPINIHDHLVLSEASISSELNDTLVNGAKTTPKRDESKSESTEVPSEAMPAREVQAPVTNSICAVKDEDLESAEEEGRGAANASDGGNNSLSTETRHFDQINSSPVCQQNVGKQLEEPLSEPSMLAANNIKPAEVTSDDPALPASDTAFRQQKTQCKDLYRHLEIPDYSSLKKDPKFFRERKALLERPELRHPSCRVSEEELRVMSLRLNHLTLRYKFLYLAYYKGQDLELTMMSLLKTDKRWLDDPGLAEWKPGNSSGKTEKDYYSRYLDISESTRHPDCCHSIEELALMSQKFRNWVMRMYFMYVTHNEGVDPVQKMEELLSSEYSWQTHPDPVVSWEELKTMSKKLQTCDERDKFLRTAGKGRYYPEELLKCMLSEPVYRKHKVPTNSGDEKVSNNLNQSLGGLGTDSSDGDLAKQSNSGKSLSRIVASRFAGSSGRGMRTESPTNLSKRTRGKRNEKFREFNEDQMETYNSWRAQGLDRDDARTGDLEAWRGPPHKEKDFSLQKALDISGNDKSLPGTGLPCGVEPPTGFAPNSAPICGSGVASGQQPSENARSLPDSGRLGNDSRQSIGQTAFEESHSCYVQYSEFLSTLKRSPDCKHSLDEIVVMAERIPEHHARKLFILRCYQYGDNPDCWDWSHCNGEVSLQTSRKTLLPTPASRKTLLPTPAWRKTLLPMPASRKALLPTPASRKALLPTPASTKTLLPMPPSLYANTGFKETKFQRSPSSCDTSAFHPEQLGPLQTDPRCSPVMPPVMAPGPSSRKRKDFFYYPVVPKRSKFAEPSTEPSKLAGTPRPMQDTSSSSKDSLHLCIVPSAYPKERLTDEQMDETDDSSPKIKTFLDTGQQPRQGPFLQASVESPSIHRTLDRGSSSKGAYHPHPKPTYRGRIEQPWYPWYHSHSSRSKHQKPSSKSSLAKYFPSLQ